MQTINAIEYSDIALFVIDAKVGLTAIDHQIAKWLRNTLSITTPDPKLVNELKELEIKTNLKKAILVANKCENEEVHETDIDAQLKRLGLGNPIYVSAVDGTGF
jgi:predicted GTPase